MSLIVEGREIALDQDGFLVDLADWSEAVAEVLAVREELALEAEHWRSFICCAPSMPSSSSPRPRDR